MIRNTLTLEKVQRQAIKFILNDYESNYITRLLKLDLLPLMYILDFYVIVFFIKAFQQPSSHFNITHYITFSHANTKSSTTNKLHHVHTHNNCFCNFYSNRLPRIWNSLPPIDLTKSLSSIKTTIYNYLWNHFKQNFLSTNPCTFHFCCRCTNCHNQGLINNFCVIKV